MSDLFHTKIFKITKNNETIKFERNLHKNRKNPFRNPLECPNLKISDHNLEAFRHQDHPAPNPMALQFLEKGLLHIFLLYTEYNKKLCIFSPSSPPH